MSIERIGRQNPWWGDIETIKNDPHIIAFNASPLKWYPNFLSRIRLKQDLIYALRGPRQVGKTTLIKNLIQRLLQEEKVNPRRVVYLDCERLGAKNHQELTQVIEDYINWVKLSEKGRIYLFIDEVTFIRNWEIGIKVLADAGLLKDVFVMVTGSHSIDIKRGTERLPGRRGRLGGLDLLLLPMTFREYLFTTFPDMKRKIPKIRGFTPKELIPAVQEASIFSDKVFSLFENYLRTGGFPISAVEGYKTGVIPIYVFDIYKDAIVGDLQRMGRKESLFKDLLIWLFNRRENPFDWSIAAREAGIGKHDTVREYIEDAECAFVWSLFYKAKSLGESVRALRSPKRLYFNDPFIFHSLRAWSLGYTNPWAATTQFLQDPYNLGFLTENIVGAHLRRFFLETFYWRNGGEIDFLIFKQGRRVASIEVKYQTRVSAENEKALSSAGGGIILTKDAINLKSKDILQIPVALFLSLLE